MQVGAKIKTFRELKNLSQEYMADRLGISQPTYHRIEANDDIALSQLLRVSEILDVKPEDLINFNEKMVFNNYTSHHANQGYIVNNVTPVEKELYEKQITSLEKEVDYLRAIVDRLTTK